MSHGVLQQKSHSLGEGERSNYTQYARDFRRALLSHKDSGNSHDKAKEFLQTVFRELDTDGDGSVSSNELRSFIRSIHDQHGDSSSVDSSKFADVLVSQIDINHDGNVSYREMYDFLWPKVESDREVGVILDLMRENFENCISDKTVRRALKECSDTNDRILIDAFAKHIHMKVLRGNLIEVRALKSAFHKLNGLGVGELSEYEVDTLIESLDTNHDGVVSPREFRAWMFVPSTRLTGTLEGEAAGEPPVAPIARAAEPPTTSSAAVAAPAPPSVSREKDSSSALSTEKASSTRPAEAPSSKSTERTVVVETPPTVSVSAATQHTAPPAASGTTSNRAPKAVPAMTSQTVVEDFSSGESGQARRRVTASSSSSSPAAASGRGGLGADQGGRESAVGDRDGGKERHSPVTADESSRLLGDEENSLGGDRTTGTTQQEPSDTCYRNWGLLIIAAVFVGSFYTLATS